MGDTGAYFIGMVLSVLSIKILNNTSKYYIETSKFSMIFSIFAIPFFDTIRVFTIRIFNKKSPFVADSNHLHHLLLEKKINHLQITFIIVVISLIIYLINYSFQKLGNYLLLFLDFSILIAFTFYCKKK
jgi:UDP-N-acetylmuramyl pentapeptide phosphotransferase/UDP-N-acetylglucosamine-1-phosphate transferase